VQEHLKRLSLLVLNETVCCIACQKGHQPVKNFEG